MNIEFERTMLKLNIYGEEIEIAFPTVSAYRKFDNKRRDVKSKKSDFDLSVEFLVTLGLPAKKVDELEPLHMNKILNALTGAEEKK